MEKRFVAVIPSVLIDRQNEVIRHAVALLIEFCLENSKPPRQFKIYSGRGLRGDEGIWLEFESIPRENNGF